MKRVFLNIEELNLDGLTLKMKLFPVNSPTVLDSPHKRILLFIRILNFLISTTTTFLILILGDSDSLKYLTIQGALITSIYTFIVLISYTQIDCIKKLAYILFEIAYIA